jgi:uncharacterized membrane protein
MKPHLVLRRVVLLLLAILPAGAFAHNVNYALENAAGNEVAWYYVKLGIEHIVPYGLDHILFVVALCLLNRKLKTILWQATAFTIAHSITLALSMKGIIALPAAIVEPIIALSIVFVAVENILLSELKPWRVGIVFLFGLIHGLGFASVLNEIGLPPNRFFLSLLSFNIGVELGQLLVIAVVFTLLILPFGKTPIYRKAFVYPLSAIIAIVALWWTIQRV